MATATSQKKSDLYLMDAKRICIIKPSALGDVVQALPLLPMLKERFPQAKISWVINRSFANLIEGHPALHEVIPFDRHGGMQAWKPLLKKLRAEKFDLVFDLQGLFRTAIMTWATRAPLRIGLQTAREMSHLSCHRLLPDTNKQIPAHLRVWKVAEALGMGNLQRDTIIPIERADYEVVAEKLSKLKSPFLAIQPGAQWVSKRWPVERFAQVAVKAMRMFDLSVVLIGSKAEHPLTHQLEMQIHREKPDGQVLNLAGETSLKQLAAVLERAEMLLTNDSGPMHLAAGLNVPLVGLFTSTSAFRSGPPPSELNQLVSTTVDCSGCYKKKCPHSDARHLACHQRLEPDRVWEQVHNLLHKLLSKAA